MVPRVSGLGARVPLTLVPAAAWSRRTSQPVRGRGFGGVGGVPLAQRHLPLQIGDLLFGVGDLLLTLGDLAAEVLVLSLQPLIFTLQLFSAGLVGVAMATHHCPWLPCAVSRCRTHPTYANRFGGICPEKSTGLRELLQVEFSNGALLTKRELHQAFRILNWKRTEKKSIQATENRSIGADPESQNNNRNRRKAGIARQHAPAELDVLKECSHLLLSPVRDQWLVVSDSWSVVRSSFVLRGSRLAWNK
jgi:hypothetical protein